MSVFGFDECEDGRTKLPSPPFSENQQTHGREDIVSGWSTTDRVTAGSERPGVNTRSAHTSTGRGPAVEDSRRDGMSSLRLIAVLVSESARKEQSALSNVRIRDDLGSGMSEQCLVDGVVVD